MDALTSRRREIAAWYLDLGEGWYPVLLDQEIDDRVWATTAVEVIRDAAVDPGASGDIVRELTDLRSGLRGRAGDLTQAAVFVRPERVMTIGCVAIADLLRLEDDEDLGSVEEVLRSGLDRPAPGVRTMDRDLWRDRSEAGEIVGAYQRFDQLQLGEPLAVAYERLVFGILPDDCSELVHLEFTTADLTAFTNLRADAEELVRSVTIETAVVA